MFDDIDLLVCGAGPVGCVVAERCATQLGWRVLVVEKRHHIAGNCFDTYHPNGVRIHAYGPHYFRTDSDELYAYLSRFTDWIPGNYIVRSSVGGILYPFPINLTTLEMFFGRELDPSSAEALLAERRVPFEKPANSEEFVLSRVGPQLYEAFYLNYTLKQWGLHPRELEPSVCGRIPVRLDRDERYVSQPYQVMPANGFTAMFEAMLRGPRIHLLLNTDFREIRERVQPRFATVYTGSIDEYFDSRLGRLPYRSLQFDLVAEPVEFKQPCVQINYPNEHEYTRSVEIKHATGQRHPETVISYETPQAAGEPYYPIPAPANTRLYDQYRLLADREQRERNVFFVGRLAEYRYYNSDEVMLRALDTFQTLRSLQL